MRFYSKKPVVVEAITFDELVKHGQDSGGNIVNGMPWSFKYKGYPVSHETDDCYLITMPEVTLRFNRGEMLVDDPKGGLDAYSMDTFTSVYEPV